MPQVKAASPATTTTFSSPPNKIAPDRHAQAGRQGRAGVTRAVAIMLAFGAEEKAVQPLVLPHGVNAIEPAGKHLVDVALVTDVEDELVLRRVENAMERDGQLDHAEIGSEMTAGLREHLDQLIAHFLRELRQGFPPATLSRPPANESHRASGFSPRWSQKRLISTFLGSPCVSGCARRGGRFKFFHDRFPGAVAGDDLNALLSRGEAFLTNLDQLHPFLVTHDQIFKREFARFHLLHDLLEPFHGLFEVRFGSGLLRLVRHNGKWAIKHTRTN